MEEVRKRNKNALRSRRLIIDAYIKLLETTAANKITVTKIVEIADLNRSTFYAHFTNPNEVMKVIEKDIIEQFLMIINQVQLDRLLENPLPLIREISKVVESNRELYMKLIKGNRESMFLDKLKELFIEKLLSDKETLKAVSDKDAFDANLRFLASGYMGILRDWFEGNISIPLDKLTEVVSLTIKGGIRTCMV